MDQEWAWDLGLDGEVRLVVDGRGVETVYRGPRIAARSAAGGSIGGHVIVIPPRTPGGEGESFRDQATPSRELKLTKDRGQWLASLEGRAIAPKLVPARPSPTMAPAFVPPSRKKKPIVGVAVAVLAMVTFSAAGRYAVSNGGLSIRGWLQQRTMTSASHATALDTRVTADDKTVTVLAPKDFSPERHDGPGVLLYRKGNDESFGAMLFRDPSTTDLDEVVRITTDSIKTAVSIKDSEIGNLDIGPRDNVDCNGQPGRGVRGTATGKNASTYKAMFFVCASFRPVMTQGMHHTPIQLFFYGMPDFLQRRDEPMLKDMIRFTELDDTAPMPAVASTPAGGRQVSFTGFGPAKYDAFRGRR